MSLLSRLFGGGGGAARSEPEPEGEAYKGFTIVATPIREGSRYRVSARIERQTDAGTESETLVRADTLDDLDSARSVSIAKAKQVIDERAAMRR